MSKLYKVPLISLCTAQPNALKGYDASRHICEKSPTYPRYIFIDTPVNDKLQQNGSTMQYCAKVMQTIINEYRDIPFFCTGVLKMYNFPSAILVDWAVFRTFLDFTKMWTRWNFESIFLKIVHQKGLFDTIKENPNFPSCHGTLHIYRQWFLKLAYKFRTSVGYSYRHTFNVCIQNKTLTKQWNQNLTKT